MSSLGCPLGGDGVDGVNNHTGSRSVRDEYVCAMCDLLLPGSGGSLVADKKYERFRVFFPNRGRSTRRGELNTTNTNTNTELSPRAIGDSYDGNTNTCLDV